MIRWKERSNDHVLVFKGRNPGEDDVYNDVIGPSVRQSLEQFDKAHMVFYFEDELPQDFDQYWDVERLGQELKGKASKIAIVGPRWKVWAKKLIPHFGGENVQTFDDEHLDEACEWADRTKIL
jgi:hypothetical protein